MERIMKIVAVQCMNPKLQTLEILIHPCTLLPHLSIYWFILSTLNPVIHFNPSSTHHHSTTTLPFAATITLRDKMGFHCLIEMPPFHSASFCVRSVVLRWGCCMFWISVYLCINNALVKFNWCELCEFLWLKHFVSVLVLTPVLNGEGAQRNSWFSATPHVQRSLCATLT